MTALDLRDVGMVFNRGGSNEVRALDDEGIDTVGSGWVRMDVELNEGGE